MARGTGKTPERSRQLLWIGIAGVLSLCALGSTFFVRQEPASTVRVEDLAVAATSMASEAPDTAQTVRLSLSASTLGTMLTIEGYTDLPDRTLLLYEVKEIAPHGREAEGTIPVLGGRYARLVDITGWRPGEIWVWVAFQTKLNGGEEQPDEVLTRFGSLGEFLYGENISDERGMKRVEVQTTLQFSP